MATFGFVTLDKTSGNGDATINVSVPEFKGNQGRDKVLVVKTQNGNLSKKITVTQAAADDTIQLSRNDMGGIAAAGGNKVFTVNGNAAKIYLVIKVTSPIGIGMYKDPTEMLQLPQGWSMEASDAGSSLMPIAVISTGEDGAEDEYSKEITVEFPKALEAGSYNWQLGVGVQKPSISNIDAMLTIELAQEGTVSLDVDKQIVAMSAEADEDTFQITSNDNWTITEE